MSPFFDDNPMAGEDEEGEQIFFDWLRVEEDAPVRVQLKKDFAESNLRLRVDQGGGDQTGVR